MNLWCDLRKFFCLLLTKLFVTYYFMTSLKEQKEALELERAQLIKETRKVQKKVNLFDKLLDDFVSVR